MHPVIIDMVERKAPMMLASLAFVVALSIVSSYLEWQLIRFFLSIVGVSA